MTAMLYYQEITLLPDAETSVNFLWTKVFTQLHIALADRKNKQSRVDIAVSFPEYGENTLGTKMRILAESEETLEEFLARKVLRRFSDYVHITGIRPVRLKLIRGWSIYSRWQPDGTAERKARRYVRRHEGVTYEEARKLLKEKKADDYPPYIQMQSLSNKKEFSLFIEKKDAGEGQKGIIGTYGLSREQAVPEF